jgi:hypothetical protein
MTAEELEQLDLRLFKVCRPRLKHYRPPSESNWLYYSNDIVVDNWTQFGNRFTMSPDMCFAYLIPEMNRRGWLHKSEQIIAGNGDIISNHGFVQRNNSDNKYFVQDYSDELAICLVADKAIKSREER